MKKTTEGLAAEMYEGLQTVALSAENKLQLAERSFQLASNIMQKLKAFMEPYQFKDEEEEIHFFKIAKPELQKELFYYEELFHIESRKPVGTPQAVKQYYEYAALRVNDYFDQNRVFYNYYLSGDNSHDREYYLNNTTAWPFIPVYTLDMDPRFSRPYSNKLAKLLAFEQLRDYLNIALSGEDIAATATQGYKGAIWSNKVFGFVEIAAALYYSGSVNYGKGGFNKFVTELASFFNLKINNVPRVIYGMTLRKKELTPFLNFITESLQTWLEQRNI